MKVMRYMLQEFYGIPEGGNTTYHYVNRGFTQLAENGGAQVETEAYIGDKNATTTVTGYENNWSYNTQYIADEVVCKDIVDIARYQKTGTECERELISIDLSETPTAEGTYNARKFVIAVEAAPPQGDPRAITASEGTLHQIGNMVLGTFNVLTKTFTPAADE